ncbi:hypothetical protein TNIN_68951 [Trichonephila inaurata madagascariensis]|uniref:Uncharacterized protein n=1 Tax=Trichonephila inaurata madagascariensis TaxID=2747483 RepID=A0A8X7CPF9_9ARAC|nr:hypothetical protein TNIN_68951 [Trichonephila inaurata madagascariensis]
MQLQQVRGAKMFRITRNQITRYTQKPLNPFQAPMERPRQCFEFSKFDPQKRKRNFEKNVSFFKFRFEMCLSTAPPYGLPYHLILHAVSRTEAPARENSIALSICYSADYY